MKTITMMLLAGVSATAFAINSFPSGNYSGDGRWNDATGKSGTYKVESKVSGTAIDSQYAFGPEIKNWDFTASFDKNYFDVLVKGYKIGHGYCQSVQCHYEVDLGGGDTLEETLTFSNGKLYKLGSKKTAGTTVSWEEELQ